MKTPALVAGALGLAGTVLRTAGTAVVIAGTALLVAAPAIAEPPKWGVHFNPPLDSEAAAMERVGAQGSTVIRLPIRWLSIEPERGAEYDWSEFDGQVLEAARHGIEIVATVHGTPDWATSMDPRRDRPHRQAPPRPRFYPDYAAHLRAMVARYGPGGDIWRERPDARALPIRAWEVHNEPNTAGYWTAGEPDPVQYARLALASARAIKAVDPGAEVVIGSTAASCTHICPKDFLRIVLTHPGVTRWTDSVSFHAYTKRPEDVVGRARAVRRAVSAHDSPATGLHLTEFGFGACIDPGRGLCVGEEAQALLLAVTFEQLERNADALDLRSAHWFVQHDLVPCREPAAVFCSFGLVALDPKAFLRERLAWEAYRRFTGGERVTGRAAEGPERIATGA